MSHHDSFRSAQPFSHLIVDSFFDPTSLREAERLFPKVDEKGWFIYNNVLEKKMAQPDLEKMPEILQRFLRLLVSDAFVGFLEDVSGMTSLIADPSFYGGGLHQSERGGKLDIHADFNRHPKQGWLRRLNVIVYLNSDWCDSYGGHLELWDAQMQLCHKKIAPVFNRMVIFESNDLTFHGHPEPLTCPADRTRKSLASYYYSGDVISQNSHSTLYQCRPGDLDDAHLKELRQRRARGRLKDESR